MPGSRGVTERSHFADNTARYVRVNRRLAVRLLGDDRPTYRSHTVHRVSRPRPYVHEATLRLHGSTDPAEVGAAVTVELCGHWEHEGGCRWPHNNAVGAKGRHTEFRTLFVASDHEERDVRDRIDRALRTSRRWTVISTTPRPLRDDEQPLAERLARTPRPNRPAE